MILVLTFMLSLPVFSIGTYMDVSSKFNLGFSLLVETFPSATWAELVSERANDYQTRPELRVQDRVFNSTLKSYIRVHKDIRNPLIEIGIDELVLWTSNDTLVMDHYFYRLNRWNRFG